MASHRTVSTDQPPVVQEQGHPLSQAGDGGANPTSALQAIQVRPVSFRAAKEVLVREHYLHSMPGGTKLAFGVFVDLRFMGTLTLGAGPANAHRLVQGAELANCMTLSRLWLSDELPGNSESRVLGVALRALRQHTAIKFLVTYADPAQGHRGTIYQATNWTYTGLSESMPLYDLGDGTARHSRSLAHSHGTHSLKYFAEKGVHVKLVSQSRKHRYMYFIDASWRGRLRVPALPYPKMEVDHGSD